MKTVYAVLVGLGQYVQHYNGIRKAPQRGAAFFGTSMVSTMRRLMRPPA